MSERKKPCGRKLKDGQYWHFCGETDMGQTLPALCTECGGEFLLDTNEAKSGTGMITFDPPTREMLTRRLSVNAMGGWKHREELTHEWSEDDWRDFYEGVGRALYAIHRRKKEKEKK